MTEPHLLGPATGEHAAPGTPTVVVEGVHVRYRVFTDKRVSLKERLTQPWKPRPFRVVHALKGVSLTAHAGEVIGVIGSNGSGKSTLMRVIAGLQPTATGEVYARATPMLLGVGAVLNRALSGRRNILLGGLALGMSRQQILEREEAIIEFSGIGEAIDRPMRTYSSGMMARLQFAISASVEPEILIIDEALAVGDAAFKRKSSRRIREMRANAGTVFIVSHSMKSLMETCTRVIWLEDGVLRADGDPRETIREYGRPDRERTRRRKRRLKRVRRQRRQRRLLREQAVAEAAVQTLLGEPAHQALAQPASQALDEPAAQTDTAPTVESPPEPEAPADERADSIRTAP